MKKADNPLSSFLIFALSRFEISKVACMKILFKNYVLPLAVGVLAVLGSGTVLAVNKKPASGKVSANARTRKSAPGDSVYKGTLIDSAYRKYIPAWKARDSAERNALKKGEGVVFRPEPSILAIKTGRGDTIYSIDFCPGGERDPFYTDIYELQDYLQDFNLCVIRKVSAGQRYYQIVCAETGEKYDTLPGPIDLSPDRKRFITCSLTDNVEAGVPTGFIIWEKKGKGIVKAFERNWSRTFEEWLDASRIALKTQVYVDLNGNYSSFIVQDTLVHRFGKWFLETEGNCLSNDKKSPLTVEDINENYDQIDFDNLFDLRFHVAVSPKKNTGIKKKACAGDNRTTLVMKYARQLKNPFIYARLCAINGLAQINDLRAINALLDFINDDQRYKEDDVGVGFALSFLRSAGGPVENAILERLQPKLWSIRENGEPNLPDGVSWTMFYLWTNIATAKSLPSLTIAADRLHEESARKAIERIGNYTPKNAPAPDSEGSQQLEQKIELENVFNDIVGLTFDNSWMNPHYTKVDKKELDAQILETDKEVRRAAMRILKYAERGNLWASRFLILRACLASRTKSLRLWALEKLSEEETWHVRTLIRTALKDQDPDIRKEAEKALRGTINKEITE
jgi:hypothetical protein